MKLKRSIEATIQKINEEYPVLMLTGATGIGRSTLLKMMEAEGRQYFSFEDKELRSLVLADPKLFFECVEPPVAIRGIQYALQLMPHITEYATKSPNPGDFQLIADHMCDLFDNVGNTMGEKVGIAYMTGLTYEEITGEPLDLFHIDMIEGNEIDYQILRGGMPALYGDGIDINKDRYFDQYVQQFLKEEVKGMTTVTDIRLFRKFMCVAAERSGELVNYAALAKNTGVSQPTAKQWLGILIAAGIVALLQPFSHPNLIRTVEVPRMYFMDTGLCAYLAGMRKPERLFKTWIVTEVIKRFYNQGMKPPIYHYRDKDGKEADLLIEEEGSYQPIEIIVPGSHEKDRIRRYNGFMKKQIPVKEWKVITYQDFSSLRASL